MVTKENVTLFICEHCRRPFQRQGACLMHEINCTKNPSNIAKCACCKHLEERKMLVYFDTYNGEMEKQVKTFFCLAKQIGVYPHKVLRTGIYEKYAEELADQELMPAECDLFNSDLPF